MQDKAQRSIPFMEMQKLPLSSSLLLNLMLYTGKMLSGAAPDGEPEGKQSWRLFPEAFYSIHQREDRLSDYTWLITPFVSETPHPKSLAMMMCTPGYSPALLLTCSVNSSEIVEPQPARDQASGFTVSSKPICSPGQDFVPSSDSHSWLLQPRSSRRALHSC